MLVGDSLTEEFSFSLLESFTDLNFKCVDDIYHSISVIECPNAPNFKISYRRNDYLRVPALYQSNPMDMSCKEYPENYMECTWINLLLERNVSLLILNTGVFRSCYYVCFYLNEFVPLLQCLSPAPSTQLLKALILPLTFVL